MLAVEYVEGNDLKSKNVHAALMKNSQK